MLVASVTDARSHDRLPGVAHLPSMEAPAAFNRLVLGSLRDVEGR